MRQQADGQQAGESSADGLGALSALGAWGDWGSFAPVGLAIALAAVACACCIALARKPDASASRPLRTMVACCCLLFCVGLASGLAFWASWERDVVALSEATGAREYTIISDPSETSYGYVSLARVSSNGHAATMRVSWPESVEPSPCGMVVRAYGTAKLSASEDALRWYHQNGYAGIVSLKGVYEVGWREDVVGVICEAREGLREMMCGAGGEGDAGRALLLGVVLGDRTELDGSEAMQDYTLCGLAHLVAVSGSHLAVVAALVSWVLGRLGASVWVRFAATLAPVAAYAALTGAQPSAIRALIILAAAMAGGLAGRRRDTGEALSACVVVMLVASPASAFSVGLALSVLSVLGLVLLGPLFSMWLDVLLPQALRKLSQPVAMTLAAQAATIPITAPMFSTVSLISPVANLACAPIVSAMICIGVAFGCAALVPVRALRAAAQAAFAAGAGLGDISASIAHVLAGLPGSSLAVSASYAVAVPLGVVAFAGLWALWPKLSRRALLAGGVACAIVLAAAVNLPSYSAEPQVIALDVGQGDAVLVRDGTSAILIDTGPEYGGLRAALAKNGISRLDAVLITHLHDDHYGGLESLIGVIGVGTVVLSDGISSLAQGSGDAAHTAGEVIALAQRASSDGVTYISPGDVITVGRVSLEVISPQELTDDGGNDDSVILRSTCDVNGDGVSDVSALFTGDAEGDVVSELAAKGVDVSADVLKVGHHGSKVSLAEGAAQAISPKLALISCGEGNSYGHPSEECLDALESLDAQTLRTDLGGQLTVTFTADGAVAFAERGASLAAAA